MRVVMPWAIEYPQAVAALREAWPDPEFIHMEGELDYDRLIRSLWSECESFILVEHDVVVRPGVIGALADCPERWCAYPYHQRPGNPVTGLGCTKFGERILLAGNPLAGVPEQPWQNVDAALVPRLRDRGWTEHVHEPWLTHLNPRAR